MSTFGPAYDRTIDEPRLTDQRTRIKNYMIDGEWRGLAQISQVLGVPEASVSAQLRHLRKEAFGSHTVEKKRIGDAGLWHYRLLPPVPLGQLRLF